MVRLIEQNSPNSGIHFSYENSLSSNLINNLIDFSQTTDKRSKLKKTKRKKIITNKNCISQLSCVLYLRIAVDAKSFFLYEFRDYFHTSRSNLNNVGT